MVAEPTKEATAVRSLLVCLSVAPEKERLAVKAMGNARRQAPINEREPVRRWLINRESEPTKERAPLSKWAIDRLRVPVLDSVAVSDFWARLERLPMKDKVPERERRIERRRVAEKLSEAVTLLEVSLVSDPERGVSDAVRVLAVRRAVEPTKESEEEAAVLIRLVIEPMNERAAVSDLLICLIKVGPLAGGGARARIIIACSDDPVLADILWALVPSTIVPAVARVAAATPNPPPVPELVFTSAPVSSANPERLLQV